jgi:hypothetical protein
MRDKKNKYSNSRAVRKNKFEDIKGVTKAVNQRRTDNLMVKRNRTKSQILIYKSLHRKLKIEPHEPH